MKNHKLITSIGLALMASIVLVGCGGTSTGNPDSEDISTTGSAISAAGGALSSSGSGGTMASYKRPAAKGNFFEALAGVQFIPAAFASSICPNFKTAQGAGCSAAGSDLWFSYNDCVFGSSTATWKGNLNFELSSGSAACGSFPSTISNGYFYRQFVTSAGVTTPSSATLTTAQGAVINIDDASANLANFDNATIATIFHGGYGSAVGFGPAGFRNSLNFGHREYVTGVFDHSLSASLSVTPTSLTARTVSGNVTVYHNLAQVIATVQFNSVVHSDFCCWPTSGSVTTSFSAGTHAPTTTGAAMVGKQETMTLTGCGTASLQSFDGTTKNILLTRCL